MTKISWQIFSWKVRHHTVISEKGLDFWVVRLVSRDEQWGGCRGRRLRRRASLIQHHLVDVFVPSFASYSCSLHLVSQQMGFPYRCSSVVLSLAHENKPRLRTNNQKVESSGFWHDEAQVNFFQTRVVTRERRQDFTSSNVECAHDIGLSFWRAS